VAEAAP